MATNRSAGKKPSLAKKPSRKPPRPSSEKKSSTAIESKPAETLPPVASAPLSPAQAYARFFPLAEAMPADKVQPFRLDPQLTYGNVNAAVSLITPHAARIQKELPAVKLDEISSLPDLAAAVLHACELASARPLKRDELTRKLAALYSLREPMLLVAEALALLGLLPKDRVAQIRSGTGAFDAAQDGVALSELYREHAALLVGRHPFTHEQLVEIGRRGQELMRLITPGGARPVPRAEQLKAQAARDRLATLLGERYNDLRRVSSYLFGDSAGDKTPPLLSRLRASRPPAAPVAAPTAPIAPIVIPAAPIAKPLPLRKPLRTP